METEKTDLELLEEQHAALVDEIRSMDQTALLALKSIDGKGHVSFDPYRYRQHKEKLKRQLPILETKMRRERDRVLKARRVQTQRERDDLQPLLNAANAEFYEAQKVAEEKWQKHQLLELKMINLEQLLQIDYEAMRLNQRCLQSLIGEITGVTSMTKT